MPSSARLRQSPGIGLHALDGRLQVGLAERLGHRVGDHRGGGDVALLHFAPGTEGGAERGDQVHQARQEGLRGGDGNWGEG